MVQAAGILLANLGIAVGEATAVIGCMTAIRHRTLNNASSAPSDASTFGLSIMLGSTAHSSGQALREPTMTILLAAATSQPHFQQGRHTDGRREPYGRAGSDAKRPFRQGQAVEQARLHVATAR